MAKKKKAKTVNAQLADSIELSKTRRKNSNGYLICDNAVFAREGVMSYAHYELPMAVAELCGDKPIINAYRSIDALTERMDDYEGLPFTDGHVWEPVTVKDKTVVAGVAGGVKEKKGAIGGRLTVFDSNCIYDIEQGEKSELSLGYTTELEYKPGTYNGQAYDLVQTEIKPNHVALTRAGRCGPECSIGDSNNNATTVADCDCRRCTNARQNDNTSTSTGDTTMTDKAKSLIAMAIANKVVHVADESVSVLNELATQLADAQKQIDTLTGERDTIKAELADEKGKHSPEAIATMVNEQAAARQAIIDKASKFVKDDMSALTNKECMVKAVGSKGRDVSDKSDEYVQAAFDSLEVPTNSAGNNGSTFAQPNNSNGQMVNNGTAVMHDGKAVDPVALARQALIQSNRKTA